jgi:hypothetical protein
MANDIFREFLDVFTIVYLDGMLIYSKTQAEHDMHVRQVVQQLRKYGLYVKLEKCTFDQHQVEFLGYVISQGISMDPTKVQIVLDWQTPTSIRDVQCFLGFANFYRQFIKNYSKIVMPLTELTRINRKFLWNTGAVEAFDHLKQAFTLAPILAHADLSKPFILQANASDFALGSVLLQVKEDGRVHPIAFHSREFRSCRNQL